MILLILIVVVLVAVAGAGLLGVGVLSEDHRRDRTGLLAALSAPVVLVLGAVLLAVLAVGVPGLGSGREPTPTDEARARPAKTVPDRRPPSATVSLPNARIERASIDLPVAVITAAEQDSFSPYRLVSGLAPGAVLRVEAEGFEWFERGSIEQCVIELGHQTACGDPFPVQFDERGRAVFQFAVRGDIAPGGCRSGQPTCLLRLTGTSSARQGSVQTVLIDHVGPGQVRVEPAGDLADGETVEVVVSGFPPLTTAAAVLCAPPEVYDARRCGPPGPTSTFAIDADGAGRSTISVVAGRLGSEAALCGPGRACGIAVIVGPGFVAAPVTPVRFSLGPGAAYEAGRLIPGVVVAVLLVGLAVAIARRTDWTKPTEAATPALDSSDLRTDQTLDDLFGTEAELDRRDPIPW